MRTSGCRHPDRRPRAAPRASPGTSPIGVSLYPLASGSRSPKAATDRLAVDGETRLVCDILEGDIALAPRHVERMSLWSPPLYEGADERLVNFEPSIGQSCNQEQTGPLHERTTRGCRSIAICRRALTIHLPRCVEYEQCEFQHQLHDMHIESERKRVTLFTFTKGETVTAPSICRQATVSTYMFFVVNGESEGVED
ncbi:hypothetical protein PIB30_020218 [Stylosanthes scabra]|uniref:Uncharacterized protein n=1 Tax=Stylosanthes scabra TaxID=79078 RepID=A0ABU6S8B9_9FABA|nr:hypothetical protein [Stylosanthes scabra]